MKYRYVKDDDAPADSNAEEANAVTNLFAVNAF